MMSASPDHGSNHDRLRKDLRLDALFRVLWFYKTVILGMVIVFASVGFLYSVNQEKAYQATALIEIRSNTTRIIKFGNEVRSSLDVEAFIENSLVQLGAPDFLMLIVKAMDLMTDPEFSVPAAEKAAHEGPSEARRNHVVRHCPSHSHCAPSGTLAGSSPWEVKCHCD